MPSGTVIPPFDATIGFTFTPDSSQLFDQVRFTTVCDGVNDTDSVRDPSGIIASYAWDFGDGRTGSGPEPTHLYREPGTLVVALTVKDTFGRVARVTRSIEIGGGAVPTAVITVSPAAPVVGETVFFSGISSTAASGLEIVLWEWDFGDGSFATGAGREDVYLTEGTYVVILRVTDSADLVGTTSTTVTIASGGPTADFGFSPAAPDISDNSSVRRQWIGAREGSNDHRVQLELWGRGHVERWPVDDPHLFGDRHLRGAADRDG